MFLSDDRLCKSFEMNRCEVLKKPKPKKISNSNILKKIIYCLENKLFTHMLYWDDKKEKEFIIKFVHKNNPKWNTTYLDLFKELDKLSYKYKEYLQEVNYEERCKGRCKSNLKKLCGKNNNGALTFIKEIKKDKSIRLMKYKLNENDLSNVKSPISKGGKMTKKNNLNGFSDCETNKYDKAYSEERLKIESLPNKSSHCLYLSNFNKILYLAIPIGATTISCGSPVGSTVKSRNEDTRNVILQLPPLTVYEHEKQMDENADSSPTISAEYEIIPSCNNLVEAMSTQNVATTQYTPSRYDGYRYSNDLPNKFQADSSPTTISAESVIPSCNNLVEAMSTENVATTQYTPSRYDGYRYSNDLPNKFQNEGLQDLNSESENCAHVVPSSPLEYPSDDPTSDWDMDISKPLQGDFDPLLSSTISYSSSSSIFEENGFLLSDIEDWFSFENIASIDAV